MIAHRFQSLGWLAVVAIPATLLYLISAQVAGERTRLEKIDRQIALAKRDIRRLETELSTRGSYRQLERWNGEGLALSAPRTEQFLTSEAQLASAAGRVASQSSVMAQIDTPAPQNEAAPSPSAVIDQIAALGRAPKPVVLSDADKAVQAAIASPNAQPQRLAAVDDQLVGLRTRGSAKPTARARQ